KLVDNAWSAPGAVGCGGFLVELLLNPIINAASGLPAAAGKNTAILNNTVFVGSAAAGRKNNTENPQASPGTSGLTKGPGREPRGFWVGGQSCLIALAVSGTN